MDVKVALKDTRFQAMLPPELAPDITKYINNPSCGPCGVNLFRKILKDCSKQLQQYYPNKEISADDTLKFAEDQWTVINCHIDELEERLKKLPPGRKQLSVARFEDQVTVVVNEINVVLQ
jgi:hypothetical protein